jgi:hypothetical protein
MPKKLFKNGGFPPLRYCDNKINKQPAKERLYISKSEDIDFSKLLRPKEELELEIKEII